MADMLWGTKSPYLRLSFVLTAAIRLILAHLQPVLRCILVFLSVGAAVSSHFVVEVTETRGLVHAPRRSSASLLLLFRLCMSSLPIDTILLNE